MALDLPRPKILTERLIVALAHPQHAPAALDYVSRNRAHFAPWDPPFPPARWTLPYWEERCGAAEVELRGDKSARFFVFPKEQGESGTVIASVNLTQLFRGPLNACSLGYGLDARWEGKGFAREAVGAVVQWAFDAWRVHRVTAGHLPHNFRSAKLLRSLGFVIEGYARDYLWIDGAWRDHVLTALVSPRTTARTADPPRARRGPPPTSSWRARS